MARKRTHDTKARNVSFYLSSAALEKLQTIGERLHKQGVPGMLNPNGIVNKSWLVEYLIKEQTK